MNILIVNCHTNNRGDEAAVRALVDELIENIPSVQICLMIRGNTIYPNLPKCVKVMSQFVPTTLIREFLCCISIYSGIKIPRPNGAIEFIEAVKSADLVLHAPGGPSLGDIYYESEMGYLRMFNLLIKMKKPYMFYAPSMGPFNRTERNAFRKRILLNAKKIILRDPISYQYLKEFIPDIDVQQTLDSAFQHDIDIEENLEKLNLYDELKSFINKYKRCIGVTITDLQWHPVYCNKKNIQERIYSSFSRTIENLTNKGYGIIFIPQLYGASNDYDLMKRYCTSDACFIIANNDERYDSYFQQYVISKMYAVIGMRYHSNIFSAKMGTPFISVSYEQKMSGFMSKISLQEYLVDINDLSENEILDKFKILEQNYDEYKDRLNALHDSMKKESYKSTEAVYEQIEKLKI